MVKAYNVVGLVQTTIMQTKLLQINQSSLAGILHIPFQPPTLPTVTASKAKTEKKRWKTCLEPSGQHQHPIEVLTLEGAANYATSRMLQFAFFPAYFESRLVVSISAISVFAIVASVCRESLRMGAIMLSDSGPPELERVRIAACGIVGGDSAAPSRLRTSRGC